VAKEEPRLPPFNARALMSLKAGEARGGLGGTMQLPAPNAGFLIYAGLALGVAFIASPAKFLAPHLSLPVALEVGRHTFRVYNRIEWGLLALLLVWCGLQGAGWRAWATLIGVTLLVLVETTSLLPALDARVQVVLDGGTPPASSLHIFYTVTEVTKVALLLSAMLPITFTRAADYLEKVTSVL
jgi:hypothetical protein